jgi:hypothetical protein
MGDCLTNACVPPDFDTRVAEHYPNCEPIAVIGIGGTNCHLILGSLPETLRAAGNASDTGARTATAASTISIVRK